MSNIYSIGLSGLQAAQAAISTAGENISNSSTTGYDVETAIFTESDGQNLGSGYVGNGVTVATVQRAYSQYITTALNNAQSSNSAFTASYNLASELANLVGSSTSGIGSSITSFFTGLEDVANSPDELATRQTAISDAQTLADEINAAGEQYDAIRTSVNTQLTDAVSQINTYTQQIASLNTEITSASSSGDAPNQLLDERDTAVSNLSQLIGVSVVQSSSGYSVFLGNGQPLVVGSQSYSLTTQTSSDNPAELTVAWQGDTSGASSSASSSAEPLGSAALQGGTVGGLVSFVTQTLDPAESQLGAIATSFASQVNQQNELGLTLSGSAGGALFNVTPTEVYANSANTGDASLSVSLTDPTSPPTDNYTLSYSGGTYTLTDTTTNTSVTTTTAPTAAAPWDVDGLSISIASGTSMSDGDSFSIAPTAGALDSFAVATTDASAIAAATPVLVSASTSNSGSASVSDTSVSAGYTVPSSATQLTYAASTTGSGGTLSGFAIGSVVTVTTPGSSTSTTYTIDGTTTTSIPYDPSTGAEISISDSTSGALSGVSFTLSGTPATGDTFTIAANTNGTQDGSNALALSNLVSNASFNGSETLTDAYSSYVNSVGNSASSLEASSNAQTSLVSQLTEQQQSVSGVNLDEEAANLLNYEQLYQASSKVIQTAESMFQTLIGIFS